MLFQDSHADAAEVPRTSENTILPLHQCTKNAPYVVQTIKCWDDIKRIEETIGKVPEEPLKNLYDDIPRCTDNKNLFSINSELQGCYIDDALTREV